MWINTGGYLGQMKPWGLPKQIGDNGDTYQNNVDKDGGYLGQMKPWGLPKQSVNNWSFPKQIVNDGGYLSKQCA